MGFLLSREVLDQLLKYRDRIFYQDQEDQNFAYTFYFQWSDNTFISGAFLRSGRFLFSGLAFIFTTAFICFDRDFLLFDQHYLSFANFQRSRSHFFIFTRSLFIKIGGTLNFFSVNPTLYQRPILLPLQKIKTKTPHPLFI